jgi:hypothetical protein
MARETLTRLIDDLDGGAAQETVTFGLDGQTYEIDLSAKNAKKLRGELAPYVESAKRVAAPRRRAGRRLTPGSAADHREQNQAIRKWAQGKGLDVADRGRIKEEIVEAYNNRRSRAA